MSNVDDAFDVWDAGEPSVVSRRRTITTHASWLSFHL
jgi:hypothetical protein